MGVSVAPVSSFGGLDLVSSPDNSACIDLLNVDFNARGAVRQRDGYDNFTSSAAADRYCALTPFYELDTTLAGSSVGQLVAVRYDGSSTTLEGLSVAGASVATQAIPVLDETWRASFTRFSTPGDQVVYVSVYGPASGAFAKAYIWDGAAWSASNPAGLGSEAPTGVGLSPTDNRLVYSTSESAFSRIRFSDAGDPETFTSDNSVDLTPGDGEAIMALVTWGNLLFAFKTSKFFVFYGNTVDATGGAVFNYRPVVAEAGAVGPQAFAVAPEGVYFCARDGIYLTNGGAPQRISDPIEPIFTGALSSFFQSSALNHTAGPDPALTSLVSMTYLNGRVYVAYPSGASATNDRMLVYDTRTQKWTLWNIPGASVSTLRVSDRNELVFAYATGSNHIGRVNSSYTTDDGTSITSRYRTGFSDLGFPAREKDIDGTRLWGTGTVAVSGSRDFGDLDTATNVTLGTSPAVAAGLHNKQKLGELVSYSFASVSGGPWTLHRYAHYLRDFAPSGERTD